MDTAVKRKLIWAPFWYLAASLLAGLFVIYLIPHTVSEVSSIISKSEQSVTFPAAMNYMIIFAVTFRPLLKLATNLVLINRWQKGKLPSCPVCQHPMAKRIAKRGSYAGQTFWGCVQFPKCGGTIHIG
jgi:hypothetical protein